MVLLSVLLPPTHSRHLFVLLLNGNPSYLVVGVSLATRFAHVFSPIRSVMSAEQQSKQHSSQVRAKQGIRIERQQVKLK